jgi:hypothetical protein
MFAVPAHRDRAITARPSTERVGPKKETTMKNVLRVVAVVLPLIGSATLAFAQTTRDQGVVTGSEQNTEEHLGLPAYTHSDSDAR